MMIDKRLVGMVPDSKKYIAGNVVLMWCSLVANIVMMSGIALLLQKLFLKTADSRDIVLFAGLVAAVNVARYFLTTGASRMSYLSARAVKKTLREQIYQKLLKLGMSYREELKTSEIVQVAVEGVEQLETYFGAYLPQFFYAMAAPLTLFIVLLPVSVPAAVLLFVCVPLIPVAIALVQTWAKKLLSGYGDQYTALGDTFLENLQGLTTLKVYQTDGIRHAKMNEESEKFRKITMKVLTMQLNSITIMDIVAYGGAALGIVVALLQYRGGHTGFGGCLLIILLSADFLLPMRHITYVSHNSYLFGGTVRDNLLMAKPDALEEELWRVLEQTKLSDFLKSEQGLDTVLTAQASNLSGGQRQRLALARALLHDSPVYLFDEATSNIDVESENDIMEQIIALAQKKTVIVISHRLANTVTADRIYVLADGKLAERGTHEKLLEKRGVYASLWNTQQALEHIEKEETA